MGLIVIRYGEIGLKGKNPPYFVTALRKALKDCPRMKNGIEVMRGHALVFGRKVPAAGGRTGLREGWKWRRCHHR